MESNGISTVQLRARAHSAMSHLTCAWNVRVILNHLGALGAFIHCMYLMYALNQ